MRKIITLILILTAFFGVPQTTAAKEAKEVNSFEMFVQALKSDNTLAEIDKLIKNGADVNAKNKDGGTPLMLASFGSLDSDAVKAVKALIKAGANVNAKDDTGTTPLMWATYIFQNPDAIKVLIKAGADVNAKGNKGITPLMHAISNTPLDESFKQATIKALIKAGADVNAKDNYGLTPLMRAASMENLDALKILIKAGASVNAKDNEGDTPLLWATRRNTKTDVIKLLIKSGADVNAKNNEGYTPLQWAVVERKSDVFKDILLKSGGEMGSIKGADLRNCGQFLNYAVNPGVNVMAPMFRNTFLQVKSEQSLKSYFKLIDALADAADIMLRGEFTCFSQGNATGFSINGKGYWFHAEGKTLFLAGTVEYGTMYRCHGQECADIGIKMLMQQR